MIIADLHYRRLLSKLREAPIHLPLLVRRKEPATDHAPPAEDKESPSIVGDLDFHIITIGPAQRAHFHHLSILP